MPYTDIEVAEQFADEVLAVQLIADSAPGEQAVLIQQVADHLRSVLDVLVGQIDPEELAARPWWTSLRKYDAK